MKMVLVEELTSCYLPMILLGWRTQRKTKFGGRCNKIKLQVNMLKNDAVQSYGGGISGVYTLLNGERLKEKIKLSFIIFWQVLHSTEYWYVI